MFYRMGDSCKTFFEDAMITSRVLEIALISQDIKDGEPVPICEMPHDVVQGYIARLVERGFKVAVCDPV